MVGKALGLVTALNARARAFCARARRGLASRIPAEVCTLAFGGPAAGRAHGVRRELPHVRCHSARVAAHRHAKHTTYHMTCCNNAFHVACVHQWVNLGHATAPATCPLCRSTEGVQPFLDHPDSIDASRMEWPCEKCVIGTPDGEVVPCEGRKCLLDPATEKYDWHARALCFPCAGVNAETVAAAPAFICKRCIDE